VRKVVLISCVSQKLDRKSKAKDLYISSLFKKNMAYAKTLKPDAIYILSAKYGLLNLDDEIEPYDVTLNTMKVAERKSWAENVLSQLEKVESTEDTKFIFLAGNNYRKYLMLHLHHTEVPMEGLPIGKQLQFLTEKLR
jgi:cytoplasmic iron level regulating protein YaaA (DUF328/UPF0246 family)